MKDHWSVVVELEAVHFLTSASFGSEEPLILRAELFLELVCLELLAGQLVQIAQGPPNADENVDDNIEVLSLYAYKLPNVP